MGGRSSKSLVASDFNLDYFVGVSLNSLALKDGVSYTLEDAPPELLAEVMKDARVNYTAFLMSGTAGRMLNPITDLVRLAELNGLTLVQMKRILADPDMQKAMAHWHDGADEMLRRRATMSMYKAIDAMEDIMDNGMDGDVKAHHIVSAAKTLGELYKAVQPVVQSGGQTVNVQVNSGDGVRSSEDVPVLSVAPRRYLVDSGDGEAKFVDELAHAVTERSS